MADDSDGYVHTPGALDESDDTDAAGSPDDRVTTDAVGATAENRPTADPENDLGPKGWVLVGVVVTATIVIPGLIYLFPAAPGEAGLPFLIAMLVLPFLPAVLLGVTAVWSMTGES